MLISALSGLPSPGVVDARGMLPYACTCHGKLCVRASSRRTLRRPMQLHAPVTANSVRKIPRKGFQVPHAVARTCDGELCEEALKKGIDAPQAAPLQGFQDGILLRMALQLHGQVHSRRKPEQAIWLADPQLSTFHSALGSTREAECSIAA